MEKGERIEDAKALSAFMGLVAFVVLLVFATGAFAGLISKAANGDWARLTKDPCTNSEIIKHIPEGFRDKFLKGESYITGKHYPNCWVLRPDGAVVMVYEDGEAGIVPVQLFKAETDS